MPAAGLNVYARRPRVGRFLVSAGILTGDTQFFPLLQIVLGIAAFTMLADMRRVRVRSGCCRKRKRRHDQR
jgi:hypothetical protein